VPSVLVATLSLLGLIANALPITPGGVGVGEAAAEALFRAVGVPGGAALVAAWRVGMIGVSIVGAGLYIFGDRGGTVAATRDSDAFESSVRVTGR
jgi:uncharacterized membrane protein YbhN (UPF0104 family)